MDALLVKLSWAVGSVIGVMHNLLGGRVSYHVNLITNFHRMSTEPLANMQSDIYSAWACGKRQLLVRKVVSSHNFPAASTLAII